MGLGVGADQLAQHSCAADRTHIDSVVEHLDNVRMGEEFLEVGRTLRLRTHEGDASFVVADLDQAEIVPIEPQTVHFAVNGDQRFREVGLKMRIRKVREDFVVRHVVPPRGCHVPTIADLAKNAT